MNYQEIMIINLRNFLNYNNDKYLKRKNINYR